MVYRFLPINNFNIPDVKNVIHCPFHLVEVNGDSGLASTWQFYQRSTKEAISVRTSNHKLIENTLQPLVGSSAIPLAKLFLESGERVGLLNT